MYAKLFRNTITNGKSQTVPLRFFFWGEGRSVHRLANRFPELIWNFWLEKIIFPLAIREHHSMVWAWDIVRLAMPSPFDIGSKFKICSSTSVKYTNWSRTTKVVLLKQVLNGLGEAKRTMFKRPHTTITSACPGVWHLQTADCRLPTNNTDKHYLSLSTHFK